MSNDLDVDAIVARFAERAKAVKKRNLPPVGGDERQMFIKQAEEDFLDFSLLGDSTASLVDGVLTFTVDLRPKS